MSAFVCTELDGIWDPIGGEIHSFDDQMVCCLPSIVRFFVLHGPSCCFLLGSETWFLGVQGKPRTLCMIHVIQNIEDLGEIESLGLSR